MYGQIFCTSIHLLHSNALDHPLPGFTRRDLNDLKPGGRGTQKQTRVMSDPYAEYNFDDGDDLGVRDGFSILRRRPGSPSRMKRSYRHVPEQELVSNFQRGVFSLG